MHENKTIAGMHGPFSLLGGAFHRACVALGLVRNRTNTVNAGLMVGAGMWLVLILLAVIDGVFNQLFSVTLLGMHARLLIVIPLLFVAESMVDPRIASFISTLVRSGIIPPQSLPHLEHELARIARWRDSWIPDAICLVIAVFFYFLAPMLYLPGTTSTQGHSGALAMSMAGQWYLVVVLTVFRFLIIRWVWRLFLWCFLLRRVSQLELVLFPIHPDGVGGLGYMEVVHAHFTPLILALSVLQASSFAEDISYGVMTLEGVYPGLLVTLLIDAALFIGPLFIFSPKLWQCRVQGLISYMEFSERYIKDFDAKWVKGEGPQEDPLPGSADVQGLADLGSSMASVREMRLAPLSYGLLMFMATAAVLPMLPLLLLKYPMAELAEKFFTNLAGF